MKKRMKGFTLIELIAVLVIMAILALIVTPLVMSIIRKARVSADKRSIDAYGRSIELAIAGYLLDTGKFPTEVSQLTTEYSGNKVECTTTQINSDSSVYLAGCTVAGRSVENYTYGKVETAPAEIAYSIGDEVSYNGVDYYVLKDSSSNEDTVTLLKAEPLTVAEVNQFGGVGTENNHVNVYVRSDRSLGEAYNVNGYGGMAYYTSETCGNYVYTGCTTSFDHSEIKHVVDAWKIVKAPAASTVRLLTTEEIITNLGYELDEVQTGYKVSATNTPSWVYSSSYRYWTMSDSEEENYIAIIRNDRIDKQKVDSSDTSNSGYAVVRPVIVLPKSAL